MSDPRKHHYVPEFLLEAWHTPPDNRLSRFAWEHRKFTHKRRSAGASGRKKGLYRLPGVTAPEILETDFLQAIDNDGALVHQYFLSLESKGFGPDEDVPLDSDSRKKWARLLASLLRRHPRFVAHIRKRGEEEYHKAVATFKADKAAQGEKLPSIFDDWVQQIGNAEAKIMGMSEVFPSVINSPVVNAAIYNAHWKIRRHRPGLRLDYLLSDRPVVVTGPFDGRFLLAMPLNPRSVFFAFSHEDMGKRIDADPPLAVVKKVNFASVRHACDHVFASSPRQAAFIQKHMRLPHEVDAEVLPG